MNFKKMLLGLCGVVLTFAIVTPATKPVRKALNAAAPQRQRPIIIIDAGHGGFDGGAVAPDGTEEKDLNLSISLKLSEVLELYGFDTILTRSSDQALGGSKDSDTTKQKDLSARIKLMNSYPDAIVISIHQNKFEQPEVHGLQVFYNETTSGSKTLGEAIQNYVNENLQPQKPRAAKTDTRRVKILEKSQNPTVIVECGFISNPTDLENLKNNNYCYTLCFCVANGVINYIQGVEYGSKD